jgi:predicted TPR repeat methyltransferase
MIGLRGSDGRLLSDNVQQATVSGNTWSITFNILAEQPVGTYTLELTAKDKVGNSLTNSNVGTIQLDTKAPDAAVNQLTAQYTSLTPPPP